MSIHNRPTRSEAAEYYFTYIDKIGEGDIRQILSAQLPDVMDFFQSVTEEQSLERNAPGAMDRPAGAQSHQRW